MSGEVARNVGHDVEIVGMVDHACSASQAGRKQPAAEQATEYQNSNFVRNS